MTSQPETQTGLFVLGMHRSGTSALTRVLNLCGASLFGTLPPLTSDNPRGYWEPLEVTQLHDQLLSAMNSSWHDIWPLPAEWERDERITSEVEALQELYTSADRGPLWVMKDPRACRLFTLWKSILAEFPVRICCVVPIRHPAEVIASLQSRDGFSAEKASLLWLRCVLDAELTSRGQPRVFTTYESLLRDWRAVVESVGNGLAIKDLLKTEGRGAEVESFLDSGLRHHGSAAQAGCDFVSQPLRGMLERTWETLHSAVGISASVREAVLDSTRQQLDELSTCIRPVSDEEVVCAENHFHERLALTDQRYTAELSRMTQEHTAELAQVSLQLEEAHVRLDDIMRSRAWRAISWYRQYFMPQGSLRRRVLSWVVRTGVHLAAYTKRASRPSGN